MTRRRRSNAGQGVSTGAARGRGGGLQVAQPSGQGESGEAGRGVQGGASSTQVGQPSGQGDSSGAGRGVPRASYCQVAKSLGQEGSREAGQGGLQKGASSSKDGQSSEWCERYCAVLYRFRKIGDISSGEFVDFEGSFFIDCYTDESPGCSDFLWECMHEHLLRCYVIDKSFKMILYENYDELLSVHLSRGNIVPIQTVSIPHKLGRNVEREAATYLDDFYKKLFKQMVRYLVDIHKLDRFTTGFDITNVAVKNGKIKFFRLKFDHVLAANEKIARRDADFLCLHNLISNIIGGAVHIPLEFARWMSLLQKPENDLVGLLPDHLALICVEERLCFLQAVSQNRYSLYTGVYQRVLQAMGDNTAWEGRIVEKLGPIYDCYKEHLSKTEKVDDTTQEVVKTMNAYDSSNASLLHFIRNTTVHLGQYNKTYGYRLNHRFKDTILVHLFAKPLYLFQEECYKEYIPNSQSRVLSVFQFWCS